MCLWGWQQPTQRRLFWPGHWAVYSRASGEMCKLKSPKSSWPKLFLLWVCSCEITDSSFHYTLCRFVKAIAASTMWREWRICAVLQTPVLGPSSMLTQRIHQMPTWTHWSTGRVTRTCGWTFWVWHLNMRGCNHQAEQPLLQILSCPCNLLVTFISECIAALKCGAPEEADRDNKKAKIAITYYFPYSISLQFCLFPGAG